MSGAEGKGKAEQGAQAGRRMEPCRYKVGTRVDGWRSDHGAP